MQQPVIITIGGGKGGVGKSFVAANLGSIIARNGLGVGFVDCDLGGANLHLFLGVRRPQKGLQDFMNGTARSLTDVAITTTAPNTWLVSGVGEGVRLTNPTFLQKQKITTQIRALQADVVLVDLGAGADHDIGDFFAAFPHAIVVSDGLPTSVENAYAYLKNGIIRGLCRLFPGNREMQARIKEYSDPSVEAGVATVGDLLSSIETRHPTETGAMRQWLHERRTFLILNMVKEAGDIAVGRRFVDIVKRYLSIDMLYIGYVVYSSEARRSIKAMKPVVLAGETTAIGECFEALGRNLTALVRGR